MHGKAQIPVPVDARLADSVTGSRDAQALARAQLTGTAKDAERRGHVFVDEIASQRLGIQATIEAGNAHECLELGGKGDQGWPTRPGYEGEVEGLLAHTVAGSQQAALACVPQGKSEHAVEVGHDFVAPFLVAMHDDLGIAA